MREYTQMIELLDCGLLSAQIHKYIRDPIHIYVPFSKLEEKIIDSGIFQRLRRIHQLQVAYSVYPGATHNRFIHSIGVMHLAGKFTVALLRTSHAYSGQEVPRLPKHGATYYVPTYEELGIDNGGVLLSVLLAVRLGGLLHDVGHMPYSHAFDEAVIARSPEIKSVGIRSHEDTGYLIFRNFLRGIIEDFVVEKYSVFGLDEKIVVDCLDYILRPRESIGNPSLPVYDVVRHVIKEFVYPADIVDFCMRDSYFTGAIEYGRIDVDRLFLFSIIIRRKTGGREESVPPYIGLMRKAIGALRAFLYSRLWLFNNVYFHKFSRLMDYTVKELLVKMYDKQIIDFAEIFAGIAKGDRSILEKLEKLDDGYILYKALESGDSELIELARRIMYRKPYLKEVFSQEITIHQMDILAANKCRRTFEEVKDRLRTIIGEELNIAPEDIIIDSPPIKFFPLNPYLPFSMFPLIDVEKHKIVAVREENAWRITGTKMLDFAVLRILLPRHIIKQTGISEAEIRRKISTIMGEELEEEIKMAFIRKLSLIHI